MCGGIHGWTASHQLATILKDADDNFTRQVVDPEIVLGQAQFVYSTSRCRHSQQYWDAGHSTASLNHCFMVAIFREQLDSKLAAHLHRGRTPAASWFQVDAGERLFVINPTLPRLQRCFGDPLVA